MHVCAYVCICVHVYDVHNMCMCLCARVCGCVDVWMYLYTLRLSTLSSGSTSTEMVLPVRVLTNTCMPPRSPSTFAMEEADNALPPLLPETGPDSAEDRHVNALEGPQPTLPRAAVAHSSTATNRSFIITRVGTSTRHVSAASYAVHPHVSGGEHARPHVDKYTSIKVPLLQ